MSDLNLIKSAFISIEGLFFCTLYKEFDIMFVIKDNVNSDLVRFKSLSTVLLYRKVGF